MLDMWFGELAEDMLFAELMRGMLFVELTKVVGRWLWYNDIIDNRSELVLGLFGGLVVERARG
jgi:hypothetical protein